MDWAENLFNFRIIRISFNILNKLKLISDLNMYNNLFHFPHTHLLFIIIIAWPVGK